MVKIGLLFNQKATEISVISGFFQTHIEVGTWPEFTPTFLYNTLSFRTAGDPSLSSKSISLPANFTFSLTSSFVIFNSSRDVAITIFLYVCLSGPHFLLKCAHQHTPWKKTFERCFRPFFGCSLGVNQLSALGNRRKWHDITFYRPKTHHWP